MKNRERFLKVLRILGLVLFAINAAFGGIQIARMEIPFQGIVLACSFAFVYLVLSAEIVKAVEGREKYVKRLNKYANAPLTAKFFTMLVGVCEEFAFRGTTLQSILKLAGSYTLAISTSSVVFALWHLLYKGRKEAIPSHVLFGLLAGLLVYIYPGNLWLPIITHMVVHVVMLFATNVLIGLSGSKAVV